jgi:peptidoglycan LD-endopeptidase LytH
MSEKKLGPADLNAFMDSKGIVGEIIKIPVPTRTVETAAQAVGVAPEQIVKSILFLIEGKPVLVITCGTAHVDRRRVGKRFGVGRKRVKLASSEEVVAETGYEVGAMPPFGQREPLITLVDPRILRSQTVYAGGGSEDTLLKLDPRAILSASGAEVLEVTADRSTENGFGSIRFLFSGLLVLLIVAVYFLITSGPEGIRRTSNVLTWIRSQGKNPEWAVRAGDKCGDAPFIMPTDGFIGFLWDDSFRPGHRHTGIDIFGGGSLNETPVYAAYSGYLTREEDWKSTVIIRIPSDPLDPTRQIWTYYTHMADQQGNPYISPDFPPGSREIYVEAGTFLGYQGNYSGNSSNPTGIHLHFSIVMDDGRGGYKNELEIVNTIDPSPYLGLPLNASLAGGEIPICRH